MKNKVPLRSLISLSAFVAALFAAVTGQAQTIVDNFTGTTLNTSNWTASLYNGNSAVTVNNGLTLTDRGQLASAINFTQSFLTITGSIDFSSSGDSLWIGFRNDGTYTSNTGGGTANGVAVHFGPNAGGLPGNAYIQTQNPDISIAQTAFSFSTGQTYNFKITDNGTTISLFITNMTTPILSATSSVDGGDRVAFMNDGTGGSAFISSLSVTAVPEPSSYAAIIGVVALVLAARRGRMRRVGA